MRAFDYGRACSNTLSNHLFKSAALAVVYLIESTLHHPSGLSHECLDSWDTCMIHDVYLCLPLCYSTHGLARLAWIWTVRKCSSRATSPIITKGARSGHAKSRAAGLSLFLYTDAPILSINSRNREKILLFPLTSCK